MKITITITDGDDGSVRVDCSHQTQQLIDIVRNESSGNRPIAATSAAMYTMGMLTWAARRSREMRPNLIVLPPGVREQ